MKKEEKIMGHDAEFQVKSILPQLIGGKITGSFIDKNNEFFGFKVKVKGKTLAVWVDADEEGNTCGALKIEEEKRCLKNGLKQQNR